jgi:hypothetical protein
MGYHQQQIPKGVVGEVSKIQEEYSEFLDAHEQDNPVMELVELADLIGAIDLYTKKKFQIGVDKIIKMTIATQEAFQEGKRT